MLLAATIPLMSQQAAAQTDNISASWAHYAQGTGSYSQSSISGYSDQWANVYSQASHAAPAVSANPSDQRIGVYAHSNNYYDNGGDPPYYYWTRDFCSIWRGWYYFDLSGIAPGTAISSASLTTTVTGGTSGVTVQLYGSSTLTDAYASTGWDLSIGSGTLSGTTVFTLNDVGRGYISGHLGGYILIQIRSAQESLDAPVNQQTQIDPPSLNLDVPTPPTISGTPPASVTVGQPYSWQAAADQPVSWSLETNATWLNCSAGGLISGTAPAETETVWAELDAYNSNGTASINWTIVVMPNYWPPAYLNSPPLNGTVGTYWQWTPQVNQSVSWALHTDALWLTLDSYTGKVEGRPALGVYYVELIATSEHNVSAAINWTLSIALPAPGGDNGTGPTNPGGDNAPSGPGETPLGEWALVAVPLAVIALILVILALKRR